MYNFTDTSIPDIGKTVNSMRSGIAISFVLGDLSAKGSAGTSVQQTFAKARTDKVRITCQEDISLRKSSFSGVTVTGEKENILRFLEDLLRLGF
jgi:hypothetical protein